MSAHRKLGVAEIAYVMASALHIGYFVDLFVFCLIYKAMIDLPALGERIAQQRKALKLTQTALANRAKVGRSTIDALENGRMTELGFTKIARILSALKLDIQLTEAARGRPTLEDLLKEDDDQGLDERR